jgi:hypothetical protein
MSKKTKVLRYTEDEFVTLLENIVKRVKKEELNESKAPVAKKPVKKVRRVVRKKKA